MLPRLFDNHIADHHHCVTKQDIHIMIQ